MKKVEISLTIKRPCASCDNGTVECIATTAIDQILFENLRQDMRCFFLSAKVAMSADPTIKMFINSYETEVCPRCRWLPPVPKEIEDVLNEK